MDMPGIEGNQQPSRACFRFSRQEDPIRAEGAVLTEGPKKETASYLLSRDEGFQALGLAGKNMAEVLFDDVLVWGAHQSRLAVLQERLVKGRPCREDESSMKTYAKKIANQGCGQHLDR